MELFGRERNGDPDNITEYPVLAEDVPERPAFAKQPDVGFSGWRAKVGFILLLLWRGIENSGLGN